MSREKFKALVHYIIHECSDAPDRLGAIRLNKALWFTDVIAYQINGASITDARYVKRQYGPVPDRILRILEELEEDGVIAIKEPEHRYDTRKFYCKKPFKQNDLTEDEKDITKSVLDGILGHAANSVSEISHDLVWEAVRDGEEIPLYATLVSIPGEIKPEMVEWAKGVVSEHRGA